MHTFDNIKDDTHIFPSLEIVYGEDGVAKAIGISTEVKGEDRTFMEYVLWGNPDALKTTN